MQQANSYIDQSLSGGDRYLVNPHGAFSQSDTYQNPYVQGTGQGLQRAYTLGGSGYGDNIVPDGQGGPGYIPNPYTDSYGSQPPVRASPPQTYTAGGYQPTPVQTQSSMQPSQRLYEDVPPTYDGHEIDRPTGVWSSKS